MATSSTKKFCMTCGAARRKTSTNYQRVASFGTSHSLITSRNGPSGLDFPLLPQGCHLFAPHGRLSLQSLLAWHHGKILPTNY